MRLDIAIVQQYGYSRNKAQAIIADGLVTVNDTIIEKASYDVSEIDTILISESPILKWVSRSAGKLEGFFQELGIESLSGKVALDIGSSTGGFTQILLEYGVDSVYCVDVGTDQLHPSIRSDSRVSVHENTDIRKFTIDAPVSIITIDVSFISLREIIPVLERFMFDNADIYVLYKPQFEVGKENLRKTGVPKDDKIIQKTLASFLEFLATSGYVVRKVLKSTVIGEAGNQEYMMWLRADRE